MIFDKKTAEQIAQELLAIKAIQLNAEKPFQWASGWKSPIYCDNRLILSFPSMRQLVCQAMADVIKIKYPKTEYVAGVATGAIGFATMVAESLGLPMVYVRPEPKKHGRQNQIEGVTPVHKNVIVVEDLISSGGSSLNAVKALKEAEANVLGMVAVFTYNFPIARANFEKHQLDLWTLSDYPTLIAFAKKSNYITSQQEEMLLTWNNAPNTWTPHSN
jgi:orotate phosphoribosyltransferase